MPFVDLKLRVYCLQKHLYKTLFRVFKSDHTHTHTQSVHEDEGIRGVEYD